MLVEPLVLDLVDKLSQLLDVALPHQHLQVPSVDLDLWMVRGDLESGGHLLGLLNWRWERLQLFEDLRGFRSEWDIHDGRESLELLEVIIGKELVDLLLLLITS